MDKRNINIKWIAVLASLCLILMLILPVGSLAVRDLESDSNVVKTVNVWQIMSHGTDFTSVSELGMFHDIDFTNGLLISPLILLLALGLLVVSFIKPLNIRRWMVNVAGLLVTVIPLFAFFLMSNQIEVITEVSSYSINLTMVLAIFLTGLIFWLNGKIQEESIYDPQNNRYILYMLGGIAILVACFLPAFGIDIKSGLNNFKTYEYTFFNFMDIASDINVMVIFSSFESASLGFMKIFYVIPLLALGLIITASRYHYLSKWFAGALSVITFIYYGLTTSILKANFGLFEGVKRVFTGSGSMIMLAGLILLFIVVYTNKREEEIPEFLIRTRANTRFAYGLLAIIGLLMSQLPQTGITTASLNTLGLQFLEPVKNLRVLFGQHQIASLTGNVFTYIGYIIPVALVVLLVAIVLKKRVIARTMAFISGVLLIVTPLINRAVINGIISEYEVGEFRLSYVWMMVIGSIFLIQVISDREDPIAISNSISRVSRTTQSILLAGFGIIQLYPLFWLILASFMSEKEMFSGKVFAIPEIWHFENYSKVVFGTRADETIMEAIKRVTNETDFGAILKFITGNTADGNIVRYFGNSLFVTGVSIVIVLICASMVAYALKRIEWKGRGLMYGFFILGMMIPVHVALAPLYITFSKIGVLGSLWSLVIPYAGFGLSFAIIVLSGFMESIPKAVEESATIDGAGRFTIFWKIILPMIRPALSTVTIFTFMGSWNELMFASIFINKGMNRTITVGINHLATAQYNTEYGLIFAGLVVASLPTLLFYLFASEQVQKSLVVGAVKE